MENSEFLNKVVYLSELSEIRDSLVRLTLKLTCGVESFLNIGHDTDSMESLNSSCRADLEKMKSLIGDLNRLISRQKDVNVIAVLRKESENHSEQLTDLRKQFKSNNLKCIQEIQHKNSIQLFSSSNSNENNSVKRRKNIEFAKESKGVTDKLSSISRQLASTVEKSSLTLGELIESSDKVGETNEEFKGMASVLGQSRKLITKYGRREMTDRVLIIFAIAFFFAVVFYVLRKRVFGPLDPITLIYSFFSSIYNLIGLSAIVEEN